MAASNVARASAKSGSERMHCSSPAVGRKLLVRLKVIDDEVAQQFIDRIGASDHAKVVDLLGRIALSDGGVD
ncbi:MAG: hypothetical protein ABI645_02085 [Pseudomonadota bacterium]